MKRYPWQVIFITGGGEEGVDGSHRDGPGEEGEGDAEQVESQH